MRTLGVPNTYLSTSILTDLLDNQRRHAACSGAVGDAV